MLISFIGGGNMTVAMVSGMLQNGFQPHEIYVVDRHPEKCAALIQQYGIKTGVPDSPLPLSDMIVLAIKPQQMSSVLPQILPQLHTSSFMSIAAGINIETLQTLFEGMSRIIRVMPNTPTLVGEGVCGAFAATLATDVDKNLAQRILGAIGQVIWVQEESILHGITAVSGCGPAYVYSCVAALLAAAQNQGFDLETAKALTYATFSGTIKLLYASQESVSELRARVMSKGGVTERGVAVLEQQGLTDMMDQAVKAAKARSCEMEQMFLQVNMEKGL